MPLNNIKISLAESEEILNLGRLKKIHKLLSSQVTFCINEQAHVI